MDSRKASTLAAILPLVVAMGLMYKAHQNQALMESDYENKFAKMENQLTRYESLIENISDFCDVDYRECLASLESRKAELERQLQQARERIAALSASVETLAENEAKLSSENSQLKEELASRIQALRVTKQSLDSQLTAELLEVEEKIATIQQSHREEVSQLQMKMESVQRQAQAQISKKEQEFKNAHRASVNHLMGMVDSLAQESESRLIPLVSLYGAQRIENEFVCHTGRHEPSDMLFAEHMSRHWLIWPVKVISSSKDRLIAETQAGLEIHAEWENPDSMYELQKGDTITLQFQLRNNQTCDAPFKARRATLATTELTP